MTKQYTIESDAIAGTNADSWTDFAELLSWWLEEGPSLDFEEFDRRSRAFAARAVTLAGGTSCKA